MKKYQQNKNEDRREKFYQTQEQLMMIIEKMGKMNRDLKNVKFETQFKGLDFDIGKIDNSILKHDSIHSNKIKKINVGKIKRPNF